MCRIDDRVYTHGVVADEHVLPLVVWDIAPVYTHHETLANLVSGGERWWPHCVAGGEGG